MDENNAKLVPKTCQKPDKMVNREIPQMVIHKLPILFSQGRFCDEATS